MPEPSERITLTEARQLAEEQIGEVLRRKGLPDTPAERERHIRALLNAIEEARAERDGHWSQTGMPPVDSPG